jgi:Abortive infection C-terminus
MSLSSPIRNKALPLAVQQTLDHIFARGSGFSGPQILDFFSQYSNSIGSYPWSGGAPSRWLIFEDCLAQFDLDQQKEIIRDLLEYDGPMSHGRPAAQEVEQVRSWLGDTLPPPTFASKVVEPLNWGYVNRTWTKAQGRITSDPSGAITSARSLLESVCKHILEERDVLYKDDGDLQRLYKLTAKTLQLSPDTQKEEVFKQVLTGCTSIACGIAGLRNAFGDSHGQGIKGKEAESRHARLAVNSAGTLALFLIETHLAQAE